LKLSRKLRKKLGLILTCIGAGIVLTIIVPSWGWIAASGVGIIILGWQILNHSHH